MNKKQSGLNQTAVWKQIEEEKKDWQYFKVYDRRELKKTLVAVRTNGYILTES